MTARKTALLFTVLVTTIAAAAACTGGGGRGATGVITTGMYEASASEVSIDECEIFTNIDGGQFSVLVTNSTIRMFGITGSYDEGSFDLEATATVDYANQGLDCVLGVETHAPGRATGDDVFTVTLDRTFSEESGGECDAFELIFPCTSTVGFTATRIGDIPPPPPPPIEITGMLSTASGFNAISTVFALGATGGDLRYDVSFGSGPAFTTTNDTWICYVPEPGFPTYDLLLGPSTEVFVSILPASWTVGPKAIDGTNVSLFVDFGDRFGEAIGGTLNILSAPTATNGTCAFSMGNVPLEGEQDPAAIVPWATRNPSGIGEIAPPKPTRKGIRPRP